MHEKLIDEWAKAEGFQCFLVDHAAVLRNLAKWLDRRTTRCVEQQVQPGNAEKAVPFGYYPNNEFEE